MLFGKSNIMTHRYFGDSSERVGLGQLWKNKSVDFQDLQWPWYAVVFIIQGKGTYIDHHGLEHPLRAGMYFQRIPQLIHSTFIDTSEDWQEVFFDFGVKTYEMMLACQMINDKALVGHCELSKSLCERHYKLTEQLQQYPSEKVPHLLPKVISLFQDCFAQSAKETDWVIQDACHYLQMNFRVSDKIQTFCREQGVGYESLRKKFKEQMNCTPRQYQNMFRMERAVELLTQSELNIEQIANKLQYCNAFEFSKQFKKFQGISPSRYCK